MYRLLLLFLCMSLSSAAPPTAVDSDVTFVKIQPIVEDTAPILPTPATRQSRIENLPLTIPGNVTFETTNNQSTTNTDDKENDKPIGRKEGRKEIKEESEIDNAPELTTEKEVIFEINQPVPTVDREQKDPTDKEEPIEETNEEPILTDSLETAQTRQGKRFDSDETTESFEIATEKYEDVTQKIEIPKRKFVSKLGFVKKTYNRYSSNALENSGLRRFRSHCRCEKIWNCPKLQISVPRCPDEYFLCCF